jgi:hypothetical protein
MQFLRLTGAAREAAGFPLDRQGFGFAGTYADDLTITIAAK